MKFILGIMFEILVEGVHDLESFLGLGREDSGNLPEAGVGFAGAEWAFKGDDGDDVMSEVECGDGGVLSVTTKSSQCLGRGSWQGGPPTPNDQNEPHMEAHFHVAILSPRTPSRTKPPGAVLRCSPVTPPWPRQPIGM